jgi:hypothetical protein
MLLFAFGALLVERSSRTRIRTRTRIAATTRAPA